MSADGSGSTLGTPALCLCFGHMAALLVKYLHLTFKPLALILTLASWDADPGRQQVMVQILRLLLPIRES